MRIAWQHTEVAHNNSSLLIRPCWKILLSSSTGGGGGGYCNMLPKHLFAEKWRRLLYMRNGKKYPVSGGMKGVALFKYESVIIP